MDETVVVKYVAARDVYVDGVLCGKTNELFSVETGTHRFDLGVPLTYTPVDVTALVEGTTPLGPCRIKFVAEL